MDFCQNKKTYGRQITLLEMIEECEKEILYEEEKRNSERERREDSTDEEKEL